MAHKAVKATKEIIESSEASKYKPGELSDNFKGRVLVLDHEKSEIAQKLKITKKGSYAVKV
jgi:RNA polymerase subunit RPABC4/transcription elongation factor Spt4